MLLELSLDSSVRRSAVVSIALLASLFLVILTASNFVIGVVADARVNPSFDAISFAAACFPNSARAQARLAEAYLAEAIEDEGIARQAESVASKAVACSPWDYKLRLLLASTNEVTGNLVAAEASLQASLSLAPHNANAQWLLANLLVREGKLNQALDKFSAAITSDPSRLPAALDLIWNISDGNLDALTAVTGSEPTLKLGLADYLLKKSLATEAARVFGEVDRQTRLAFPESAAFIYTLIAGGQVELAHSLWLDMVDGRSSTDPPLLWNGSFESQIQKKWSQFDWNLENSNYAQIAVVNGAAHDGAQSLRITFTGRDTTRLNSEIKQLILVKPGVSYRLECYAKTEELVIPEGPSVVVTSKSSSTRIAASEPIATGSHDWQPLVVDFTAPIDSPALVISIKRIPKFSYDDPAQGTIWLDNFTLRER